MTYEERFKERIDSLKSEHWPSREKLQASFEKALKIVDRNMEKWGDKFPVSCAVNGCYPTGVNKSWIAGFWPGIVWLCYELTGDNKYRVFAERHIDSFYDRIKNKEHVNHHDMGFLYSPSCVAAYKLTGNKKARKAAMMAADHLCGRFMEKGQFLNAWYDVENTTPEGYFYIIDCLLNIPLLYWATDETGKTKYRDIAEKHHNTTMNTIIRPDGSAYHSFYFDHETGEPLKGKTKQGYSDDSAWSRGQAWGILGFALNYAKTQNQKNIECFKRVTDYYISHLPNDYVPYWDLIFTQGDEPKDSSAAVIFICGILEMAKHLQDDQDMKRYIEVAGKTFDSIIDNYASDVSANIDGLLIKATGSVPHNMGINEPAIFGDYYYLEAIVRSVSNWEMYW
jgi:unsaturated chondroitin disaccharide hydrolase